MVWKPHGQHLRSLPEKTRRNVH
uniref:Uncharacterized protein n=1 Tax=Anguilla anguilla TaxID=7936 RepID=A0A0E9PC64_ANGAN